MNPNNVPLYLLYLGCLFLELLSSLVHWIKEGWGWLCHFLLPLPGYLQVDASSKPRFRPTEASALQGCLLSNELRLISINDQFICILKAVFICSPEQS